MITAITGFELTVLLFIQNNLRTELLNDIFVFITHLGDFGFLWVAAALVLLFPRKTRRAGVFMLICLAVAFLINDFALKPLFARIRPYDACSALSILIPPETSFSFPSGHANIGFAGAYALTRAFGKRGAWAYIPAALIALSRCYVGVHHPSDILAGALVGTLCAAAAWYLANRYIKTDFTKRVE